MGWLAHGLVLGGALVSAGCPVPLPAGYTASSRENLGAEVTSRLVAGVTTREDVLLLLGEPDQAPADGAWLAYNSVYGRGGVLFVLFAGGGAAGAGGEQMEYRRLVVTFDEQGRLLNAEYVSKECWEGIVGMGSSGGRSPPCLDTEAKPGGQQAPITPLRPD